MIKSIFFNSLILSFGILLGRLSGYIRELIIAKNFQVSQYADNVVLLLTVPDLLNNLISTGAVAGILIPLLSSSKNNEISSLLFDFMKKLITLASIFYILLILIFMYLYELYLFVVLSISLLSIFINLLTFLTSSYLQYKKRFKVIALNTLVFNSIIIVFLFFKDNLLYLSFGVIIASTVRLLWTVVDLRRINESYKIFFSSVNKSFISYKKLFFVIIANGLLYVNPVIDKIFASFLTTGSTAILSYSEKIYMLPVSIFLTSYAIVMFPDLAKLIKEKNFLDMKNILFKSILLNLFFSISIASIIFLFSFDIVNIVYGLTNLELNHLEKISSVLNGYLIALVFSGIISILMNVVFSFKRYDLIMYYSLIMLLSNILLDYLVIKFNYTIEYLAYSTSLVSTFSVLILSIFFFVLLRSEKNAY